MFFRNCIIALLLVGSLAACATPPSLPPPPDPWQDCLDRVRRDGLNKHIKVLARSTTDRIVQCVWQEKKKNIAFGYLVLVDEMPHADAIATALEGARDDVRVSRREFLAGNLNALGTLVVSAQGLMIEKNVAAVALVPVDARYRYTLIIFTYNLYGLNDGDIERDFAAALADALG